MSLQLPTTDDEYGRFRDSAIDAYTRWLGANDREVDAPDLGLLLDWKWNYGDRRLNRLTRQELEEFLLEWCPRKLSMAGSEIAGLPESVAVGTHFLADEGVLRSGDSPARLADHARRLADSFVSEMDNPEKFGMGKSILHGMDLGDPSALTPDNLQRAMEEFNRLPYEERKAITDPAMGMHPEPMVIGPVAEPRPDAVYASVERAPMLRGFRALAEYLGSDGKPLTKTGALKLADARSLVDLLDTGESMATEIGARTFKVQSARELPHLDHWQWWAQECGAIRTVRGRLVPVKAWRRRVDADPVAEALKAVRVLFEFGVNASYSTWYYSELDGLVDQAIWLMLGRLLTGPGPLEYAELVDQVDLLADGEDVPRLTESSSTLAVADTLDLLERAGVIEQHEITTTEDGYRTSTRTGGKITITPFGVVALIEVLRAQGVEVNTLADPAGMDIGELVAMIGDDQVGPEQWWNLAGQWLEGGAGRTLDQSELRDVLAETPMDLLLLTGTVPDQLRGELTMILRTITEKGTLQDELVAAAMTALAALADDDGQGDAITEDERDQITVTMIAITGPDGPEETVEAIDSLGPGKAYELIKVAARHPCASSEKALAFLGEWHTDRKVAKLARKELFRLRSKLAAARS